LAFSSEVLLDYNGIDSFCRDIIDNFSKKTLFRRFALDNISAIHLQVTAKRRIRTDILQHYNDVTSVLGNTILDQRISDVRNKRFSPSISRQVE
jgi:hypothetical protein